MSISVMFADGFPRCHGDHVRVASSFGQHVTLRFKQFLDFCMSLSRLTDRQDHTRRKEDSCPAFPVGIEPRGIRWSTCLRFNGL